MTKSIFRDRDRSLAAKVYGTLNCHHVLNLFEAYRWEREHPRHTVLTDRYREWLLKRDAAAK